MINGTGIAGSRTAARGGMTADLRIAGGLRADGPQVDVARSAGGFRIGGHASLFGVVDLGRDAVEPGAFAAALARRGAAGIRMLFQHDPAEPVGRWTAIREDATGLWVEGRLTAGVQKADELAALILSGALDGLSIGFRTVRAANDRRSGVRRIVEADLWEVSIVTFPMLPGARLSVLPDGKSAGGASPGFDGGRIAALRLAAGLRSATRTLHGKERA